MSGDDRLFPAVKWRPILGGLAWVAGLVLFYLALKYVVPYFTPFLIAIALAVLINPTVNGLEDRMHMPRGWAVAVTLFFFFGLVLGLVLFGVGAVIVQLGQLAADFPAHYNQFVAFAESVITRVTDVFRGLPPDFANLAESTVRSNLQSLYLALQSLVRALLSGLAGLPQALLVALISLVATFFLSRDKDLVMEFLLSLLPPAYRGRVAQVNRDVVRSAVGLIKAQLTLVGITMVIIVTGLFLLGVKYAWIVGLAAGLLDVLPAVGPATVLVPWAVYCFIDGNAGLGFGLVGLVAVITVFRQVMEPRIVGQRIGLHPLLTLLALYLGVRLLGAAGLVVGPLVAIVIKAVIRSRRAPQSSSRPARRGLRAAGAPPAGGPSGEPVGPADPAGPTGPPAPSGPPGSGPSPYGGRGPS